MYVLIGNLNQNLPGNLNENLPGNLNENLTENLIGDFDWEFDWEINDDWAGNYLRDTNDPSISFPEYEHLSNISVPNPVYLGTLTTMHTLRNTWNSRYLDR